MSSSKRSLCQIAKPDALNSGRTPLREAVLSILFLDVRNYTQHVEASTPKAAFRMLSKLFDHLVEEVEKQQGVVDKFMGDALMALFDGDDSADRAVEAAIGMQQRIDQHNRHAKNQKIRAGIGINTGPVIVGSRWVGENRGHHLSVVGDAVNLAARLETLTKTFNSRILISHYTHAYLRKNGSSLREIDTLRVRGRQQLVNVYEVFATDPPKIQEIKRATRMRLFQGIAMYKAWLFEEALEPFQDCLRQFPDDPVTISYLRRCKYFRAYPPLGAHTEEVLCEAEEVFFKSRPHRAQRFQVQIPVGFSQVSSLDPRTDDANQGKMLDISSSGARLEAERTLPIGATTKVQIFWEQGRPAIPNQDPLEILGTTIWSRAEGGSGEFGIEFLHMDHKEQNELDQILGFFSRQSLWD